MNGVRLANAQSRGGGSNSNDAEIRQGATSVSPIKLMADHQWRTLYAYTHPFSRATVLGQGSSADYLSVNAYTCDLPTGGDLPVLTPIYTPQQYDSYSLPIDGSTAPGRDYSDVQNIDITPGNSTAIGVVGKSGRRLPFLSGLVPGRGINAIPYGQYDFKKPADDSPYIAAPPQGPDAAGTIFKKPGATDRVVNKPEIEVYLSDKGLTYMHDDANGFTPIGIKVGNGLSLSAPDPKDENRRFLQANPTGGGGINVIPSYGISIEPPFPPVLGSLTLIAAAGGLGGGQYAYGATYTTNLGNESAMSGTLVVTTDADHGQVTVAMNPATLLPANVASMTIYRSVVNDITQTMRALTTIPAATVKASGVSFTDNVADPALGAVYGGGKPSLITAELATDAAGNNISGLIENAGADGNGLAVDPYGPAYLVAGPGISITPPAPPSAPTLALATGTALGTGGYKYAVAYQYNFPSGLVETNPSFTASINTTAGNQAVVVSAPAPPAILGATIVGAVVYRTALGGTALLKVATVAGASALSYTDSTPDGSLGSVALHQKQKIQADLATKVVAGASTNVSGLVSNAGDDGNGLQVNVDGTTITINTSNQLVAGSGSGAGGAGCCGAITVSPTSSDLAIYGAYPPSDPCTATAQAAGAALLAANYYGIVYGIQFQNPDLTWGPVISRFRVGPNGATRYIYYALSDATTAEKAAYVARRVVRATDTGGVGSAGIPDSAWYILAAQPMTGVLGTISCGTPGPFTAWDTKDFTQPAGASVGTVTHTIPTPKFASIQDAPTNTTAMAFWVHALTDGGQDIWLPAYQ
ncbi:MAG: hypothetical protein LC754_10370 [Acidobacteria bacterium]|nr:hypothetical protein [Acidobacteriota bacterium]